MTREQPEIVFVPDTRYAPTEVEWEAQRSNIERLYVSERRSLKEVMQIMASVYNFRAT